MIATAFSGWITPKTFISIGQNLLACQKSRQRTLFSIKLIVRSSTKVLLKTGAVVEEGAVHWVIFGLIIHALCDISDVVAILLVFRS